MKLKNQKPIVVDVLFKAYPMVPLSCSSNLADGTFNARQAGLKYPIVDLV